MEEKTTSGLPSTFEDGDVYDLVCKDLPYGLDFYVGLAREANGPVLDIACGTGRILLPCQVSSRYFYKQEMELLLRIAGFTRWEICGDFDRRPLTRETDAMVVTAWCA